MFKQALTEGGDAVHGIAGGAEDRHTFARVHLQNSPHARRLRLGVAWEDAVAMASLFCVRDCGPDVVENRMLRASLHPK